MKRSFQYVVPVLKVSHLASAIEFFEAIGFVKEWGWGDPVCYAGLYSASDHVIHLQEVADVTPGATEVYLQVANVDEFYEVCEKARLKVVVPLTTQAYGMRDFTLEGPDGIRVTFGQELE